MLDKGTILGGYRIEGLIGQGGMGVVYTATQLSLDRTVALKVLATHLTTDEAFRERFRREGLIQAAIDHPHIVTVFEAGESEHGLFLAMRLIRGKNLRQLIREGSLDAGRTIQILTQVADALDTAHEAGLVHRDIKPQNVLVATQRRDQAYLADFGITKALLGGAVTATGALIGTPDYMAPEQWRGESATSRSDIYSLAAVMYECLTGMVPFPRDSDAAIMYAHLTVPPPRLTDTRPELPVELSRVIEQGMAKSPDERPPTASQLVAALEAAVGTSYGAAATAPGTHPADEQVRPAVLTPTTPAPRPSLPSGVDLAAATPTAEAASLVPTTPAPRPSLPSGVDLAAATPTVEAASLVPTTPAPRPSLPSGVGPSVATPAEQAMAPTEPATTPAEPAQPPTTRATRLGPLLSRHVAISLLVLGVGGVALLGFAVARASAGDETSAATTTSARAGDATVTAPADWRQPATVPKVAGITFADPLAVVPSDGVDAGLVVGGVEANAPGFVPVGLLSRLPDTSPTREVVRLGKLDAFRYRNLEPRGSARKLTLYVVPQTTGVTAVTCFSALARSTSVLPACEQVAATLRLDGAKPYPLAPTQAYAAGFNRAMNRLKAERDAAVSRLRQARTSHGQADAAAAAARAYAAAAKSLGRTAVTPYIRPVNAAIVGATNRVEGAYRRLAAAARAENRAKYDAARKAVRAEDALLQSELAGLRELGFTFG